MAEEPWATDPWFARETATPAELAWRDIVRVLQAQMSPATAAYRPAEPPLAELRAEPLEQRARERVFQYVTGRPSGEASGLDIFSGLVGENIPGVVVTREAVMAARSAAGLREILNQIIRALVQTAPLQATTPFGLRFRGDRWNQIINSLVGSALGTDPAISRPPVTGAAPGRSLVP